MRFLVCLVFAMPTVLHAQQFTSSALSAINSSYDEQNPLLSPDRKTLWFTIANHPQNIGGKKDPGDIWYSTWSGGLWSAPVHGGSVINDRGYNSIAGFSAVGDLLLFNHYGKGGEQAKTQGFAFSKKTSNGWQEPENITIPYFQNRSAMLTGQLTPDGSVFVYAAESYDSRGAEDIYVAVRNTSGTWSEPKNLGAMINTPFQEASPWLSADKRYLYFSSNGRRGYGSFDVYFSERQGDSWTSWSVPVNSGSRINSEGRELFYHTFPDLQLALFTSTQNSDGYGDIRFYADTSGVSAMDTTVKMVAIRRENRSGEVQKRSIIKGVVTDTKTGQPIEAKLEFRSDSIFTGRSSKTGSYSVEIPSTSVYSIVVEAAGYVGVLEKLDIHTFEMREVELNFKLQPIEVGATVNLKNVLFEISSTNLLPDSYAELNVVVDLLKNNPKIEIELAGHTDNRGDAKLNVKLSKARVEKVKSYLVSKGIAAKRIRGKGYGGTRPITNSNTEEARMLNRRVEFTIVKD